MVGSQGACRDGDLLPDRLAPLEEMPPGPIALVDAALFDDGGTKTASAVLAGPPR